MPVTIRSGAPSAFSSPLAPSLDRLREFRALQGAIEKPTREAEQMRNSSLKQDSFC